MSYEIACTKLPPRLAAHYCADYAEEVGFDLIRQNADCWDRILASPANFPKADFDTIEALRTDAECVLLAAPLSAVRGGGWT